MRNLKLTDADLKIICSIYIVLGILLSFFNVNIILLGSRIMGIILMLVGVYFLYCFFGKRRSTSAAPFFIGVPSFFIGLYMAMFPERFVSIVPSIVGILFIISSIVQLQRAFMMKDSGISLWKISLGVDIVVFVIGALLFFKPIQSLSSILKIVGILMVSNALFTLWNHHLLNKKLQETN